MADAVDINECGTDFWAYTGAIDHRLERFLWHLEDEPKKDVIAEIFSDFEFEELEIAREKLFHLAKSKARENHDDLPEDDLDQPNEKLIKRRVAIPWTLINRRAIGLLVQDICDIYLYLSGVERDFPSKILKRQVLALANPDSLETVDLMPIIPETKENLSIVSLDSIAAAKRDPELGDVNYLESSDTVKSTVAPVIADNFLNTSSEHVDVTITETYVDMARNEYTNVITGNQLNASESVNESPVDMPVDVTHNNESLDLNDSQNTHNESCQSVGFVRITDGHPSEGEEGDSHKPILKNVDNETLAGNIEENSQIDEFKKCNDSIVFCENGNPIYINGEEYFIVTEVGDDTGEYEMFSEPPYTSVQDHNTEILTSDSDVYRRDSTSGVTCDSFIDINKLPNVETLKVSAPSEVPVSPIPRNRDPTHTGKEVESGEKIVGTKSLTHPVPMRPVTPLVTTVNSFVLPNDCVDSHMQSERVKPQGATMTKRASPVRTSHTDTSVSSLNISSLSQESLLREIQELHDRICANSSNSDTTHSQRSTTPKNSEMATQTSNVRIPDNPVMRPEFDMQSDYTERSLTDHERRVLTLEMRGDKNDKKVSKMDAEIFIVLAEYKSTQDMLLLEMQEQRKTIEYLMSCRCCSPHCRCDGGVEQAQAQDKCPPSGPSGKPLPTGIGEKQNTNLKTVGNATLQNQGNQMRDITPATPDIAEKRPQERKKGDSLYESFMKAAKKVMPHHSDKTHRETDKSVMKETDKSAVRVQPRPEKGSAAPEQAVLKTYSQRQPLSQRPGMPTLNKDGKSTTSGHAIPTDIGSKASGSTTNSAFSLVDFPPIPGGATGGESRNANILMSTPLCKPPPANNSWAEEEDDEVSKTIEVFLAEIEKNGHDNSFHNDEQNPPASSTTAVKAVNKPDVRPSAPYQPPLERKQRPAQQNAPQQSSYVGAATRPPPGKQTTYGGARPKDRMGGESTMVKPSSNINIVCTEDDNPKPAKIVTRNGWCTPTPIIKERKRKRTKSSPKSNPPLRAVQTKQYKDIFVRGLSTEGYDTRDAMEDAIIEYCEERGVALYFVRIMMKKSEPDEASIKITVSEEDMFTVLDHTFWPRHAEVREWYPHPLTKDNGAFGNGKGPAAQGNNNPQWK